MMTFETATVSSDNKMSSTTKTKKNTRTYLLLGVFGILLVLLIVLVVNTFVLAKQPANTITSSPVITPVPEESEVPSTTTSDESVVLPNGDIATEEAQIVPVQ